MDSVLKTLFTEKIKATTEFEFEDFVNELFLLRYGSDDFVPMRKRSDEGSDGIVESKKTIIACYGPEKYQPKSFEEKANGDFDSYSKNWASNYSNWTMIVNHDIAPAQTKLIKSLKADGKILGLKGLVSIIENELTSYQRRLLGQNSLGIPKEYFRQDYLAEILRDLLNAALPSDFSPEYKSLTDIEDKIRLNYDEDDVQGALGEFYEIVAEFGKIERLIRAYDDEEKKRIKAKILRDHNKYSGNFKAKLQSQTESYLEKHAGSEVDDDYEYFIRAVLLYHFEQCLLGKKAA